MKLNVKKILVIIFMILLTTNIVSAEEITKYITVNYKKMEKTPINFPTDFNIKKDSEGKYIYCMTYNKKVPNNIKYTFDKRITDAGTNYILSKGLEAKNDTDYFVAQTALWIYLIDKNMMDESTTINQFKAELKNTNGSIKSRINTLVETAKKETTINNTKPTISIETNNITFKPSNDNKYYVSNKITINSSEKDYEVELKDAPEGTKYDKNNNEIYITVPKTNNTNMTFSLIVKNKKENIDAYYYNPSDNEYQVVATSYKREDIATATKKINIIINGVEISKQDATTGEELEGAKLVIKSSNGEKLYEWTSTKTPHVITDIKPGTYILEETIAPNGYELSKETVKFRVKNDGTTTKVVMKNTKVKEEIVVPDTKSDSNIYISLIGLGILSLGLIIIKNNNKRKNNI